MRISKERLFAEAEATGFRAEILEKAIQLLNLLENLCRHPFLKGRLALKGGTALNMFVFDLPRLSGSGTPSTSRRSNTYTPAPSWC